MKKKFMTVLILGILLSMPAYAQEDTFTFEQARQKALSHSKVLALQEEIKRSIGEKNAIQKTDYSQNNPDYEYHGMEKIPVYTNTYKTYDYQKIYDNLSQEKKEMVVKNEKKTLDLFTNIINLERDRDNKKMELSDANQKLYHADIKKKNGLITNLEYAQQKIKKDTLEGQLKGIEGDLSLAKKQFAFHLGLGEKDEVKLILTQPKLELILPREGLKIAEKKQKQFEDIKEEIKDLQEDMKWIELVNYGFEYQKNTKEQKKKIEDKEKDLKELKKDLLYANNKTYYDILVKLNEIELDKLNYQKLEIEKTKIGQFVKQGMDIQLSLNQMRTKQDTNLLEQTKKMLELRHMLQDYILELSV